MDWVTTITFDQLALSAITLGVVRASMIHLLPDHVAGPGGWLVDTSK